MISAEKFRRLWKNFLTISGIGRKTANLLLGDIYGKPSIVTDTHFIRITGRLGLTKNTEPKKSKWIW